MSFSNDEGWFWYWWQEELEEDSNRADEERQPTEYDSSLCKRIKVTEENENILCAKCGEPLGEQGDAALVKIERFSYNEREYFCEKCAVEIER